MNYKNLSDEEIWVGMADTLQSMSKIGVYQEFLGTGTGLPKDPDARTQLMVSNIKITQKLRDDYDALFAEIQRRYTA